MPTERGYPFAHGSDIPVDRAIQTSDSLILGVHQYGDKTYALIYNYIDNSYYNWIEYYSLESSSDKAGLLAKELGGHLYVQSSDDEVLDVEGWLLPFINDSLSSHADTTLATGIDCETYESVCDTISSTRGTLAIGAVVSSAALTGLPRNPRSLSMSANMRYAPTF